MLRFLRHIKNHDKDIRGIHWVFINNVHVLRNRSLSFKSVCVVCVCVCVSVCRIKLHLSAKTSSPLPTSWRTGQLATRTRWIPNPSPFLPSACKPGGDGRECSDPELMLFVEELLDSGPSPLPVSLPVWLALNPSPTPPFIHSS